MKRTSAWAWACNKCHFETKNKKSINTNSNNFGTSTPRKGRISLQELTLGSFWMRVNGWMRKLETNFGSWHGVFNLVFSLML